MGSPVYVQTCILRKIRKDVLMAHPEKPGARKREILFVQIFLDKIVIV